MTTTDRWLASDAEFHAELARLDALEVADVAADVAEEACTCGERQWTVCHDIRNEPHLVGCPRWGTRKRAGSTG